MSEKIPVLTDNLDSVGVSKPRPSGILPGLPVAVGDAGSKVVDLATDTIQNNIKSVVRKMTLAVDDGGLEGTGWKVSEFKISLSIDANGQVSVLSLTKAQLGAKAALEVKVVRE